MRCIYTRPVDAARDGERAGGSGFLVGIYAGVGSRYFLYAVTNKHIVENAGSRTLRLNTVDGFKVVDTDLEDWIRPAGDDLAVVLLGLGDLLQHCPVSFIPEDRLLTKDVYQKLDIGPGSDPFLIGRFVNREGKQRNTPCVRFGNIALEPGDPIPHPDGYPQESFLVEVHSIGGFSGSPVFTLLGQHDWSLVNPEVKRFPM